MPSIVNSQRNKLNVLWSVQYVRSVVECSTGDQLDQQQQQQQQVHQYFLLSPPRRCSGRG